MKKLYLIVASLFSVFTLFSQKHSIDIVFENNSAEIILESQVLLDSVFHLLPKHGRIGNVSLEIFPIKKSRLIDERIEVISAYLENKNHSIETLNYFNKREHLYFDTLAYPIQNFNRLTFHYVQISKSKEQPESSISTFTDEPQLYFLEQKDKNQSLFLDGGVILDIPVNAFVTADGRPYENEVLIKAEEFLTPLSTIAGNLNTNYGNQILESRGMVSVFAFTEDGDSLYIAENKSIDVNIPIPENSDETENQGFQNFQGTIEEGRIKWELTPLQVDMISRPSKKMYVRQKLSEEECAALKIQRANYIEAWEERGRSKKTIRQTLKRYKTVRKKRERSSKKVLRRKGRNYKVKYTRSNKDYEQITKYMILSNVRHRWHLDTGKFFGEFYYNSPMTAFGYTNIDRIYKSGAQLADLSIQNKNQGIIKLVFLNEFIILEGKQSDNEVSFPSIPIDEKLILIYTKDLGDKTEFSYKICTSPSELLEFDEFETLSDEELSKRISTLLKSKQT